MEKSSQDASIVRRTGSSSENKNILQLQQILAAVIAGCGFCEALLRLVGMGTGI